MKVLIIKLPFQIKYPKARDYKFMFTLDDQIAENRARLREIAASNTKTDSYYAVVFAFTAFVGVYIFDILAYLINTSSCSPWYGILLGSFGILTACLLGCCLLFFMIIRLQSIGYDVLPKKVYKDAVSTLKKRYPSKQDDEIYKLVKEDYLLLLEEELARNMSLFKQRRKRIKYLIKAISFTFIIYIWNIVCLTVLK